jgi:cyclopropane fatty-acyl-phospholipid synthase-like methyltransferase
MQYSKEHLYEYEKNFWLSSRYIDLKHLDFYKTFFNFDLLENKNVLDIGCGGNPVCFFTNKKFNLTIVDPLINDLSQNDLYGFLKNIKSFSGGIHEFDDKGFDVVVCLNVIDHFYDDNFTYVDKFYNFLAPNGELWLYYDVRPVDMSEHLAINNDKLIEKINKHFKIKQINEQINPKHIGWSGITKSIRLIATKN